MEPQEKEEYVSNHRNESLYLLLINPYDNKPKKEGNVNFLLRNFSYSVKFQGKI